MKAAAKKTVVGRACATTQLREVRNRCLRFCAAYWQEHCAGGAGVAPYCKRSHLYFVSQRH